jgi:folate-binding protein YgfZ
MSEKVIKHLDHFLISEQVEIADRTRDFAQLHLAGPRACAVLNQGLGADLSDLREHQHVERTVADTIACQLRRHDPLGLTGFDIVCPAAAAAAVWQRLVAAGARPAGKAAFDCLRIEAGTADEGVDFDENNLVMELGRTERAICYTKGCFLGQEPIVRSRDLGHVNWSFKGLRLSGQGPVSPGAKILREGKDVGRVTSSALSPRLGNTVALAFVRRGSDAPGTTVEVATGEERRTAEVTSLPFPA